MRIRKRKYEASFYYQRLKRADCPDLAPDDPEVYYCDRISDIRFSMPNILDAFGYAKEFIENPNCDAFITVLDRYFIPYKLLQWCEITMRDSNATEPVYECRSHPFLKHNGDTYEIRIKVWCLDGKENLPEH